MVTPYYPVRWYGSDLQAFGMYNNASISPDSVTVNPPQKGTGTDNSAYYMYDYTLRVSETFLRDEFESK